MDQNHERRRGHFHRGRRGPDRRGIERRTPPRPSQTNPDQVDVEQIMGDIRARIAQRQGIELSNQQIQDLAARRLESILDPRAIKPSLLEGLRRSAGASAPAVAPKASSEPVYSFEDTTIYDSHRAILRFMRRLLNPLLKLFFNPNPVIRALHLQARLNVEAAEREADRDRRQAEWNALHYEILQRVVTDVSRVSLEVQALSMRVESLNARVDFNDRRVRSIEGAAQSGRPGGRMPEAAAAPPVAEPAGAPEGPDLSATDVGRRRRRRRRGRRGGVPQGEPITPAMPSNPAPETEGQTVAVEATLDHEAPSADEPSADPFVHSDPIVEPQPLASMPPGGASPPPGVAPSLPSIASPPAADEAPPAAPPAAIEHRDTDPPEQ